MSSLNPFDDLPYGWLSGNTPGQTVVNVNSATTFHGASFVLRTAQTLNAVRMFLSVGGGTYLTTDVRMDIYLDDGTGTPNLTTSLANATASATSGWANFSGMSLNLTAGSMYWAIIKNLNASPTVNFPAVRMGTNSTGPIQFNTLLSQFTWGRRTSTNGGSTWSMSLNVIGMRIDCAGGVYAGVPQETAAVDSTNKIYSTRKAGSIFTTPSNVKMNVTGVMMTVNKSGTPTGNLQFQIYQGTNLIATTAAWPGTVASVIGASPVGAMFSSPVTLSAGTAYRVVASETTQSDANTNFWETYRVVMDSDATSLTLKPLQGTISRTYFDGTSWADTSTEFVPFMLLLDGSNPYSANSDTLSPSDLKIGVTSINNGNSILGTYDGSDRWSDPLVGNVRSGTAYKANSLTNNEVGTAAIPTASQVLNAVAVDATTGNVVLPTTAQVKTGITFGASSGSTGTYTGSDRWSDPGSGNVRSGTAYKADSLTNNETGTAAIPTASQVLSGVAIDATTGNVVLPSTADVKTGVTFGSLSGSTGTYTGADRWSDPGIANVRSGTAYKANSITNNETGTAAIPTAAQVLSGVSVDNTTGNVVLPTAAQVKTGIGFGSLSGLTGTYTGSDRWTDPGTANVRSGTTYKADSLTANQTGTAAIPVAGNVRSGIATDATVGDMVEPSAPQVKVGVAFGSLSGLTGTYDGSDRWSNPNQGNVRLGVPYKANSLSNNQVGTCAVPLPVDVVEGIPVDVSEVGTVVIPTTANVRSGVVFDNGSVGLLNLPTEANVKIGVQYDDDTKTGTYTGGDRWSDPGSANVADGVTYLANAVQETGTLVAGDQPAESDVKIGVVYDSGTMTGTYTGADRWTDIDIDHVLAGFPYKANSTTNNKVGSLEPGLVNEIVNVSVTGQSSLGETLGQSAEGVVVGEC